tara:strand:+ start:24129 stop:24734 length:606 start_codon:yes stop_codon:yes gene_type:complete
MPSKELLAGLWDFVHGRSSIRQFKEFVSSHSEGLEALLPEEKVGWLLELDDGAASMDNLRAVVGRSIAAIELECACLRFPSAATTERNHIHLPRLVDTGFALIEHCIDSNLALIAKDRWYAREWQASNGAAEVAKYVLQDGCFYCCRTCSRSFLIVLDESNLEYLVLCVSARELSESTPQQLRERFAADFGLAPVAPPETN